MRRPRMYSDLPHDSTSSVSYHPADRDYATSPPQHTVRFAGTISRKDHAKIIVMWSFAPRLDATSTGETVHRRDSSNEQTGPLLLDKWQ